MLLQAGTSSSLHQSSDQLHIPFATTNTKKLREASLALGSDVQQVLLKVDERQIRPGEIADLNRATSYKESAKRILYSRVAAGVARTKALSAFNKFGELILTDDASFFVDAERGRPGPMIKMYEEPELLMRICESANHKNAKSNRAYAVSTLSWWCGDKKIRPEIFQGLTAGTIATEPRGSHSYGFDKIFIPDGCTKTMAEMLPEVQTDYSMRIKACIAFRNR